MFFLILLLFLFVIIISWNSKIEVKIYNLDISTARKETIKRNFDIYLGIIIFNKIEIFKINIKKIKNKKVNLGRVIEISKKFQEKNNKKELLKELIRSLREFQFEIQKADLNIELGTEDAALTAILVGILAGILGTIFKKQKFKILPIYTEKNILNLKLDCIFRINLIHYIYKTILKGREKNERKSSDRRTYVYGNE